MFRQITQLYEYMPQESFARTGLLQWIDQTVIVLTILPPYVVISVIGC